jgi:hypothetical protein
MKTRYVFLAAMLFLGPGVSGAMAQGVLVPVTGYDPVTSYYAPASYLPANCAVANHPAPAVAYRPVVTQYVQPAVAYEPLVVQAGRVQPYVAYQRPYVVYSPAVAAGYTAPVYSAPVAVAAGPKVWVHPKVYVEGQPIRNLLRAITP